MTFTFTPSPALRFLQQVSHEAEPIAEQERASIEAGRVSREVHFDTVSANTGGVSVIACGVKTYAAARIERSTRCRDAVTCAVCLARMEGK